MITKICKTCKKEFEVPKYRERIAIHCSNNCKRLSDKQKKYLSEINKGKKLSDETKIKIGLMSIGRKPMLGRKFTEEHKLKISNSHKGKMAYQWKGGISNIKLQQEKIAGRKRPNKCEICGESGRICFDHNHKTNEFRGWICHRCNAVLGFVDDNPFLLGKMLYYLQSGGQIIEGEIVE